MPLSTKKIETERLARLLAKQTGESFTDAIEKALKERPALVAATQPLNGLPR